MSITGRRRPRQCAQRRAGVFGVVAALDDEVRPGGRSMESQHFDRITRIWATSSRRRVLASLGAIALTALSRRQASAACQEGTVDEFPCGTRECIGGEFINFFDPGTVCRAAVNECDLAEVCIDEEFDCPNDRKKANGSACTGGACCGGQCFDILTDESHCGSCNIVCSALTTCCGGECHDLKSSPQHCGQCGSACPGGSCCDGQCFNTQSDQAHCGSCDVACSAGQLCCDGTCVDPQSNKLHCGQCGHRCRRGSCRTGRCKRRRKK
jgi:hypothetical protein